MTWPLFFWKLIKRGLSPLGYYYTKELDASKLISRPSLIMLEYWIQYIWLLWIVKHIFLNFIRLDKKLIWIEKNSKVPLRYQFGHSTCFLFCLHCMTTRALVVHFYLFIILHSSTCYLLIDFGIWFQYYRTTYW